MYDVLVIGAGVGGYSAAIRAAKSGFNTAIVEEKEWGGTCLNRGCIPTKYLITKMHEYKSAVSLLEKGIYSGSLSVNFSEILEDLNKKVQILSQGIEYLLRANRVNIYQDRACIIDKNTVMLTNKNECVKAKNIIVATGSIPQKSTIFQGDVSECKSIYTTDDVFTRMRNIPESISIVGAGAVGLEFACIFAGFGAHVTLIDIKETLFGDIDYDLDVYIHKMLKEGNIELKLSCSIDSVIFDEHGVSLFDEDENLISRTESVLSAYGRIPNMNFMCSKLGNVEGEEVCSGEKGYSNNNNNIFYIGDVTGNDMLAYKALREAKNTIDSLRGNTITDSGHIPHCIFLDEEIAYVGVMEQEAQRQEKRIKTSKYLMSACGRSRIDGNSGFIKIISDEESKVILGGLCVSKNASELISYITMAVNMGFTVERFCSTVFPHPTYSEALFEAIENIDSLCVHML